MYRKLASIAILLVLALCTAGTAFALPFEPEVADAPGGTGFLGEMWGRFLDWLGRMAGGDEVTPLWLDGSHCDPNWGCSAH